MVPSCLTRSGIRNADPGVGESLENNRARIGRRVLRVLRALTVGRLLDRCEKLTKQTRTAAGVVA